MTPILLALAFVAQPQQPQPENPPPAQQEFPVSRRLTPAHDLFYDDVPVSSLEARVAMHRFGSCVADRSRELAENTIASDFTTRAYRSRMDRLIQANGDCFRDGGRRMRSSQLLLAGAIAEALIERDGQPLNVRLARAALQPATRAYSASDQIAICVVRSLPDEVARLMATDVGSAGEEAATVGLAPALAACSGQIRGLESNSAGLRAILATAAYRSINSAAATGTAQRD